MVPPPPTCPDRRRAASGRLFTVVAFGGVVVALGVASWLAFLRAPRHAERPEPPPAAPIAAPSRVPDGPPLPLAEQIRAAVAALATPKRVRLAVGDSDAPPLAGVTLAVASRFARPRALLPGAAIGSAPLPRLPDECTLTVAGERLELHVPRLWPDLDAVALFAPDHAPLLLPPLVLADGDLDLEPFPAARGARLRGRILAAEQRPAAGASVALHAVASDPLARARGLALPIATRECDAQGFFAFEQVGSRVVLLEVEGAEGDANGGIAEAIAGETPVALELVRAAPPLTGTVVDPGGRPLPGATLVATQSTERRRSSEAVASDADGRFEFTRLAPGYYAIDVQAPGFARRQLRRAHSGTREVTIELAPLAMARVELLGAPRDLVVPLLWQTLAPDGKWRRPTSRWQLAELREGSALLRDVPPGRHALELRVPGAAPFETAAVEFLAGSATDLGSYTLEAGATLRARITGPDGAPRAARATLAARYQSNRMAARDLFALDDRDERSVGSDGVLAWSALPAGPRTLGLRALGCADRNVVVELPASGVVDLGSLALDGAGAIEGVVRRLSGVPLGDATLQAEQVGGVLRETTTGADGRYRFERLPAGRFELRLLPIDELLPTRLDPRAPPREPQAARLDVVAGEVARRDFTLDS
ncbi:MAG: carboxypeptidase regulatory-like domain-containing protein [Planctomycetes bacterium]|nr:carboxypeptidase regulatory-like domain-containing protein [Planctomycetota bacterium]